VSEELWKRFVGACDHFFEAKNAANAEERGEQQENLKKKQDIIEQLKALLADAAEATGQKVRELQQQWNEVGFVPIRDKDKLYKQYHEVVDELYKKLNLSQAERRLNSFKTTLKVSAEAGANTLARERERLARAYDIMKGELQTYENNIGFLSVSSKKGSSLIDEMNRKVQKLKDELSLVRDKIKAIDAENAAAEEES
jgi:flagellin-specific chaperone FliS